MTLPDVGDIAWVDLSDAKGTEQSGRRPALILTSADFHQRSRRCVICPITSKVSDWPTTVALPQGLRISGVIMVDQVRSIDRAVRLFDIVEKVPPTIVVEVRKRLGTLLGIDMISHSHQA